MEKTGRYYVLFTVDAFVNKSYKKLSVAFIKITQAASRCCVPIKSYSKNDYWPLILNRATLPIKIRHTIIDIVIRRRITKLAFHKIFSYCAMLLEKSLIPAKAHSSIVPSLKSMKYLYRGSLRTITFSKPEILKVL